MSHLIHHISHTIHHNLSTFCTQKPAPQNLVNANANRRTIPAEPKINHKAPQLTTNPEDRFFPQPNGLSSAIDLKPFQKARPKIMTPPNSPAKQRRRNPHLSIQSLYPW
jgi:hypothetical protein